MLEICCLLLNKSSVIVACGHIVKLFLLLSDYKYHTQVSDFKWNVNKCTILVKKNVKIDQMEQVFFLIPSFYCLLQMK